MLTKIQHIDNTNKLTTICSIRTDTQWQVVRKIHLLEFYVTPSDQWRRSVCKSGMFLPSLPCPPFPSFPFHPETRGPTPYTAMSGGQGPPWASGFGWSPTAKRFMVHFERKITPFGDTKSTTNNSFVSQLEFWIRHCIVRKYPNVPWKLLVIWSNLGVPSASDNIHGKALVTRYDTTRLENH